MSVKRKLLLTEADREMYAAERLDNFRWISQVVARPSKVHLTKSDRVPPGVYNQISEIGQFAEIVYSSLPLEDLLRNYASLSREGFPLEGYTALKDTQLECSVLGDVAQLPAAVFWRPSEQQIVVSICGTKLPSQALQDVRVLKTKNPSGPGHLHTGFWTLYMGLRNRLKSGLRQALNSHHSDSVVSEIVLTGHSMGGAVTYLLGIDLLREDDAEADPILAGSTLKIVTFGTPRVGDEALVEYFHTLVDRYQQKRGAERFAEYSVRTYNDGVPALPPLMLGYRHFPKGPIYATGDHLYYIPSSERERTLFHVHEGEGEESGKTTRFPRGGHNYYGGRELEKLTRRITWLEKANMNEDDQWEKRYLSLSGRQTAGIDR